MIYGRIPGVDKPISRLVQGTMMINSHEADKYFGLLDAAFSLGLNTLDTAHDYGKGDSERTVGQWIMRRDIREKLVIIGKGAHHNQDRKRVTPFDITSDLYDSLARLRLDYIDLYLLHRDDPSVAVGPIIDILNKHCRAGLIRAFGASNWTYERIQEANEYAQLNELQSFSASSPNFCLAEQYQEPWQGCVSIGGQKGEIARDWYKANQFPLFTWSSLAGGFFSGRFSRQNINSFESRPEKTCAQSYGYDANFERLARAYQLAKEKGLTVAQLALAYVFSQPLNLYAIVGCREVHEVEDDVVVMSTRLTATEIAWLELKTEKRELE